MRKLLLVLILFIAVNGFAQGLKLTGWTTTTNPATARTALGISNQFDFLPTRVLYVSTNGNDSTFVKGRRDLPARNFGYAASNALSGELVYVFAGEFKKTNTTCATNVSFYFEPGSRLIQTNDTESMFSARDGGSAITNNIFGSGVFIHHSDINPTFDYDIVLSKLNLECQSVDSLGTGALFQMDLGTINVRATDFLNSRGYDFIYGTPIWGHIDVPNIYVADDLVEFTGTFPGQTFFHLKAGKIVIGNPPSGAVDGDNAQMNTNTFIECDQLWITNGVAGLALIRGPGTMTVGSVHIAANVTNTFVQGAILKGSKIYVASGGALYTQNFEPADSPGIDSPPVFIDCQMDTGVIISNGPTLINVTIGTNLYNTSIATNSVIGTELNSQKQVPLVFTGAGYSRSGNTLTFSGSGSFNGTNMAKAKTIVLDDVDSYTITNGSLDGSMIVMDCTFADNTVTITDQDRDGYPFHFYKRNSGGFISTIATSGDSYTMTNDGDSLMLISVLATNGSQYWLAQRNDGTGNFPNGITVGGQAMTFTPSYATNAVTGVSNITVNATNAHWQIYLPSTNTQIGFTWIGNGKVQIMNTNAFPLTNSFFAGFKFGFDTNTLISSDTNVQRYLPANKSLYVEFSRPTDADTNTTVKNIDVQDLARDIRATNVWDKLNVKFWGAKGDGAQDDRLAIQAALDFAYTLGGGVVRVPEGVYILSTNSTTVSHLTINDNVSIVGDGWTSELVFTNQNGGLMALGSTGNQAGQDAGNTNISIRNLKVRYETAIAASGIAISLAGVSGGAVENVWVDNCGGYSIYLGKNNGTADTDGKHCDNIKITGCRVTRMLDVGVELYGAENCIVSDTSISGPGTTNGSGTALYFWGGAIHNQAHNLTIEGIGASNNLNAIGFAPQDGTNTSFLQTSNNVVKGVLAQNIKKAIRVGSGPVGGRIVWNSVISNARFLGQSNAANTVAVTIANATGIELDACRFDTFSGDGLRAGHTSDIADQTSITNLYIHNSKFLNVLQLGFYGVQGLQFVDNLVYNVRDASALVLFGVQEGILSNNRFSDIGYSGNAVGISAVTGVGTRVRPCLNLTICGNKGDDSRATKYLNTLVNVQDASDYIVVANNSNAGGKVGGIDVNNLSSGTSNSILSSLQTGGFAIVGGDLRINNAKAIKFLDSGSVTRSVLTVDSGDNVSLTGTATGSDMKFGTLNSTKVTIKSTGNVGIGTTAPDKALEINSATGVNLRLTYNDSNGSAANFTDFSVSSSGDLTIAPSGGDTVIAGRLASTATSVTVATAATTFAVGSNVATVTGDALANVVATITGGVSGQMLTLIFVDALVTITDTGAATADTVNLSAAFVGAANTTLTLIHNGTKWFETSRSVN